MSLKRLIAFALLLLAPQHAHAAADVHNEHTTITLMAEKTAITKGEAEGFRVAVQVEALPGWHTYGKTPAMPASPPP